LWEEKTATGQDPRMNVQSWVQKNLAGKLDSYLRARQYLPGYEAHPILRSLMTGLIATALVLAERAGGHLPETTPEQAAAWARLRQEHARSMSR
jgi:hypothetical protein